MSSNLWLSLIVNNIPCCDEQLDKQITDRIFFNEVLNPIVMTGNYDNDLKVIQFIMLLGYLLFKESILIPFSPSISQHAVPELMTHKKTVGKLFII